MEITNQIKIVTSKSKYQLTTLILKANNELLTLNSNKFILNKTYSSAGHREIKTFLLKVMIWCITVVAMAT